jgi:hypothetical protein
MGCGEIAHCTAFCETGFCAMTAQEAQMPIAAQNQTMTRPNDDQLLTGIFGYKKRRA